MEKVEFKVLLIEDDVATANLIRRILAETQSPLFRVEWTRRLQDGIRRITRQDFDVVLLDLKLPDASGTETIERVWQHTGNRIPVLALTGLDDNQLALKVVRKGAQDCLPKEKLNHDMLLRVIRYSIERSRLKVVSRDAEQKYQVLFQNSNDGIILHDLDGRIVDVNERALDILGYSKDELIGSKTIDLHPDDVARDLYATVTAQIMTRGYALFEIDFKHKEGSIITAEVSASSFELGKQKFIQKIIRDITERKRTEQKLLLQDTALTSAANGIVITDRDGKIQWVNSAFSELTGYSYQEVMGKNPRILKSNVQTAEFYRNLWDTILSGKVWRGELINARKDGSLYFEEQTITPVRNERGEITHFIGIKTDITERRRAEDKLRESEEKFHAVAENATDAIISADSDGKIIYINKAAEKLFGYSCNEVISKSLTILMPRQYREAHQNGFNRFLETGDTHLIGNSVELIGRQRNGSEFPMELSLSTWMAGGRTFFTAIVRDISERKQTENSLKERERYLRALNIASQLLLSSHDIPYQEFVEIVGPASLASRAYVFLTHIDQSGNSAARQVAQWCAEGVKSQIDHPWLHNIPTTALPRWTKILSQGEMIAGAAADFPRKEKNFLVSQGIKAIMLLPLMANGECIGFIGFDNCISNRVWERAAQEYLQAAASDLTEAIKRKQAEKHLKESEDRFRSIFEEGPMGIALIGPDLRYIRVNKAFCNMLGYTETELKKLTMPDITHPNERERDKTAAHKLFSGQIENFKSEKRYTRKDNSFLWANINVSVIKDSRGKVQYIITSIEDITERKNAEKALIASEKKFKRLFEDIPDAIFITRMGGDNAGEILDVNPAAEKQSGYSRNELIGMNILYDLKAEAPDRKEVSAAEKSLSTNKTLQFVERKRRKDGVEYWTEVQTTIIDYGDEQVTLSVNRDITERVLTERALKEHEQKLRTIIEHSNELFYIHNTDHVLTYVSPQCKQMLGYAPEEMMVRWTDLATDNPLNQAGYRNTMRAIETGERQAPYLLELRRKEGATRLVEVDESPIKNDRGEVIGISGALRDVTVKEKAEAALKESEAKFRSLADQSPNMIFINQNGRIVYTNNKSAEVLGYTKEELCSEDFDFLNLIAPESIKTIQDHFYMHKQGKEVPPYEYTIITKEGRRIEAINSTKLIDYNGQPAILGVVTDITERTRSEKELQESEKRFRNIFEQAAVGMVHSSPEGRFIRVNQRFCDIVGYSSAELSNMTFEDITHPDDLAADIAYTKQLLAGEIPNFSMEKRYICKGGDVVWVKLTVSLVLDSTNQPEYFIGVVEDITSHKKIEDEIRWLAKLPEENPTPIVRVSKEGMILYANKAAKPILKEWQTNHHQRIPDEWLKFVTRIFDSNESQSVEVSCDDHIYSLTFAPILEQDYVNVYGMDITDLKQTEALLRKRTHDLGERVKEMTCIYGITHLLDNPSYTLEEKLDRIVEVIPRGWQYPEITCARIVYRDQEHVSKGFRETPWRQVADIVIKGEKEGTLEVCYLEERPEMDFGPFLKEEKDLFNNIVTNIQEYIEYQKAIDELRNSEERLKILFEAAPDAIYLNDLKGNFVDANKAAERLIGMRREQIVGRNMLESDLLLSSQIDKAAKLLAQNAMGRPTGPDEFSLNRSDGSSVVVEISTYPVKIQNKNLVLGIARDITVRRKAEEALRYSEEKYRTIFEESRDVLYISSVEGKFQDVNPAGVELFGYDSLEELKSVNIQETIYANPLDRDKFQDTLNRLGSVKDYEMDLRRKNGEPLTVLVSANVIKDEDDRTIGYRGLIRDITRQKVLERQLLQAQKMEAIGTLAGGIAHDFNNILGAILGYTELTKELVKEDAKIKKYLEQVYKTGVRARDLVHQILTFSRQTEHKPHPLQIELVIKEALKLLRATLPSTIEVRQDVQKDCGYVLADPTQIHQVIMNLCTNAHDAMRQKGGILELSLHRVLINNNKISINGDQMEEEVNLPQGNYLRLTVRDNGSGMDADTVKRIFDPFFTTKEAGSGTGLGLSVVHGIVKKHEGEITVWSEPGKGTAFHIYLPEHKKPVEDAKSDPSELVRGSERILYVDDEQPIVETGMQILQSLGYQVTGRTSSPEALRVFEEAPHEFDLIITDLTMPKMTGVELANKAMKIRPDIPIILITGFSDTINKENAGEKGIRELLMKPFLTSDLSAAIRRVLDDEAVGMPEKKR